MAHGRGQRLKRILDAINLPVVERLLRPHYVKWERGDGVTGRPPHNPVGLVVAMLIQLVRAWTRERLVEFLEDHPEWVRWLGFESVPDEATWSHLLDRVPQETLDQLLGDLVTDLKRQRFLFLSTLAGDGSFLPACAKDADAQWGYVRAIKKQRALPRGLFIEKPKEGIVVGYGYRIHALVDATAQVPLAVTVTRANVNDAKALPDLVEKASAVVDWNRARFLALDSGYDETPVRELFKPYDVDLVIHPRSLPKGLKYGGFRGARRTAYKKRTGVERFFAVLKSFFDLQRWGIRGLARVGKWVSLAAVAVLVVAWANDQAGRPKGSVKAFVRQLP